VLSFAYTQNPDGRTHGHSTAAVQLQINSNPLLTLSLTKSTNTWINLGWATTSVLFTATSPSTLIAFASQTAGMYGVLLDCIDLTGNLNDGFENTVAGDYVAGVNPGFGGWTVTSNQVTVISNSVLATRHQPAGAGRRHNFAHPAHRAGPDLYAVVCLSRAGCRSFVARGEQRS